MCFWILLGVFMWADIYGDKEADTPETAPDSESYLGPRDIPVDIPGFFRAEPAVLEAGRIIRGCSLAHFIPDGRVVR